MNGFIPVNEQTIARMGPEINDLQQEALLVERTLPDGNDNHGH